MIIEILTGLLSLTLIGTAVALLLSFTAKKFPENLDEVVQEINKLLPQTQCALCDYPGCKPYAAAIAAGEDFNHCPPGGDEVIQNIANLLGKPVLPLNTDYGENKPIVIARIREQECIGCTFCIKACPVDAIIGAAQQMHIVITDECTGCELCLDPCPVDCIDLVPTTTPIVHVPKHISKPIKDTNIDISPCIRCGECEQQCPKDLAPQALLWQRTSTAAMTLLNLDACIECRICDRVCPSHIPLTIIFIETKQRIQFEAKSNAKAKAAEARFDTRNTRLITSTSKIKTRSTSSDRAKLLSDLLNNKRVSE